MDDKVSTHDRQLVQSDAALDIEKLGEFLHAQFGAEFDSATLSVERFTQGYSNLTYLLHIDGRELVLRRPPIGANIKSGHDMAREYRLLTGLYPIYPQVPRTVLYSDDLSILGAPFYIMERVRGVVLQTKPPAGVTLTPDIMQQISRSFIENLAVIHSLDYTATDLKSFARPGSYVERQISGWLDRYAKARTDDLPALERAGRWLEEHRLPDSGSSLIHNDYKYDNLMLDPNDLSRIVAVLDWEMATIGDPLMDLGTSLAYWVQPDDPEEFQATRMGLTTLPGNFDRAQLVQEYARRSGREVGDIVFYYVYGLFKIAVIAQQIYARYKKGLSSDARFALLPRLIQAEGLAAVQAIEKKRIDRLSA